MKSTLRIFGGGLAIISICNSNLAQGLFSDDFSNGLGKWTGRFGGAHNGVIVPDPLNSGRGGVLTFSALNGSGDIFTGVAISSTQPVIVRFDYLGLAKPGSIPGDFGGSLGISGDLSGNSADALASTFGPPPGGISLVDDGQWHSMEVSRMLYAPTRFWIQDWVSGTGSGVPGDAYFDNIQIIPEPSPFALVAFGFLAITITARRQRSQVAVKAKPTL